MRDSTFKGISRQISLLAKLHKTTQLSVNHEGRTITPSVGVSRLQKRSGGICNVDQWINFNHKNIKGQNNSRICFLAVSKPVFSMLSCILGSEWDLRGETVLDISAPFQRMKKRQSRVTVGSTLTDAWVSPRLHFTKLNGSLCGLVSSEKNEYTKSNVFIHGPTVA